MAGYNKIRQQTIESEETRHLSISILSLLLAVVSASASWYLNRLYGLQIFLLAGAGVSFIFTVAFIFSFALFMNVKAEKPASRISVETLMRLLDKSPYRKEILSEMEMLLKNQGEIYQYQIYALILRAKG